MKDYKVVLIAFLAGVTIFSGFKYFAALKQRYGLLTNINQLNSQVTALENEKQSLVRDLGAVSQENLLLKDDLKLNKDRLSRVDAEFQAAQKTIEELNAQISAVKAENIVLTDQMGSLKLEVAQAAQEKEKLQARLSSITELKKAIKELRQKIRMAKRGIKMRTREAIVLGNRGYLIKDGKPTYPSKIKIEVQPLPSEN